MPGESLFTENVSILRLPESLQRRVDEALAKGDSNIRLELDSYDPDTDKERRARFYFNGQIYPGLVKFLPRVLEIHKSTSQKIYTKATDIQQIIYETLEQFEENEGTFYHENGITPPMIRAQEGLQIAQKSLHYKDSELVKRMDEMKGSLERDLSVEFEELVPKPIGIKDLQSEEIYSFDEENR